MCIHRNNFKSCMPPTKQTKIQVRSHYGDITHSPHDMLVHVTRPRPLPFLNRRGSSVNERVKVNNELLFSLDFQALREYIVIYH